MQIIRPKAFAIYASFGLGVLAILMPLCMGFMWDKKNPAYPCYEKMRNDYNAEVQKIETAKGARAAAEKTKIFQEVLLGAKPATDIQDLRERELAQLLQSVASANAETRSMQTAEILKKLPLTMHLDCTRLVTVHNNELMRDFVEHRWGVCATPVFELVRADPDRVTALLKGDKNALSPLPEVPTMDNRLAAFPQLATEPKEVPIPWTRGTYLWFWLVFSDAFALAYAITGWIGHKGKEDHPLRAVPGFALGWLIILATLPGFLLVYALWLVWLVLTGDVASAIKKLNAKRSDARLLKLANQLIATLKAHKEVNSYRNPAVRVSLEPENLRTALASNILPESMKDEVEEYLELSEKPPEQPAAPIPAGQNS